MWVCWMSKAGCQEAAGQSKRRTRPRRLERGRRRTRQDKISRGAVTPMKLRMQGIRTNEEKPFLLPDRVSRRKYDPAVDLMSRRHPLSAIRAVTLKSAGANYRCAL